MIKRIDVAKKNSMLVDLMDALYYNKDTGGFVWKETMDTNESGRLAGYVKQDGYRQITFLGIAFSAHSLAWAFSTGSFSTGEIDHINHDRGDNRIINLREVSHAENARNQKLSKKNKSGIQGVFFYKPSGKWMAYICINDVRKNLGYYTTIEDAAAARREAEKQYGFHENHGREFRPCMEQPPPAGRVNHNFGHAKSKRREAVKMFNLGESATYLGTSRQTLTKWRDEGKFPQPDQKSNSRVMLWSEDTLKKFKEAM